MAKKKLISVQVRDYHVNGKFSTSLTFFYIEEEALNLDNWFLTGSGIGSTFKRTSKCNVMVRNHGKLVSYKTLKRTHPDLYKQINSLPNM